MVVTEMKGKGVYQGQQILFLGTIKATVRNIYIRGRRVPSAYFANTTRPIFRSESAKFVLYIQMSREMWDFDTEGTGGIMRSKVITGFLPELFKRWKKMNARHLVSIVLFTRVEYDEKYQIGDQSCAVDHHGQRYRDFYRVVVSETDSGEWTTILNQLKTEFNLFLRDILLAPTTANNHDPKNPLPESTDSVTPVIAGRPASALHGNVLEAINLASSQFSEDYVDRDLVRTGLSIVIITPGTGVFEVDAAMLRLTTDNLVSNGIAIDIICLASMPLHSVPLFKYRAPLPPEPMKEAEPVTSPFNSRLNFIDTGSFTNQILASESSVDSRSSELLGKSPVKFTLAPRREWLYAIPHWIDISFWTNSLHERHRHHTVRKTRAVRKSRHNAAAIFRPRCRMYELQMMGLMETEMSNISIPYLHDTTPEAAMYMSKQRNASIATGSSRLQPSPHMTTNVPGYSLNRTRAHRHISREEREEHRWMDRHDERLFKLDYDVEEAKTEPIPRSSEATAVEPRQPLNRAIVSTSSVSKKIGYSPGSPSPGSGSFLDQTMMSRRLDEVKPLRRGSNADSITSVSTIRPRPAQRTSAFGSLRWALGLQGSSKAVATTGATTEFVNSAPALFRKPDQVEKEPIQVTNTVARQVRTTLSRSASTLSLQTIKGAMASKAIPIQMSPKPILKPTPTIEVEPMRLDLNDEQNNGQLQPQTIRRPLLAPKTESQAKRLAEQETSRDDNDPWLTVLNPSNPRKYKHDRSNRFRRWQHLFPRPPRKSSIKWKSLCAPAALPLTNEDFPSLEEFRNEYQERPYRIALGEDDDLSEHPKGRSELIRELVSFRLSHGFQIVVGTSVAAVDSQTFNVFDEDFMSKDGAQIFMSKGNDIHQLSCILGTEVQITRFQRRRKTPDSAASHEATIYRPLVKYALGKHYEARNLVLALPQEPLNWSYVDNFIAGYNDGFTETLRYWRARFVLIPVDTPATARKHINAGNEVSEEEIRLEGIQKITQIWQRYRYIPPDERSFQAALSKKADPNPLAIEYQTRDPSMVLSFGLDNSPLTEIGATVDPTSALFSEAELYKSSNIDLHKLALDLQSDTGIRMRDRRWHFKMHLNCFVGSDLTGWLLSKFKDIETREDAVELGNQLMERGMIQHVSKKHRFRDGYYFYEVQNEYKAARPESRSSWFGTSRKPERSVPSTPVMEPIRDNHSLERYLSRNALEDSTHEIKKATHVDPRKTGVMLSAVMQYDLDPRGKSYRPEVINLHYGRLHHPDNCYHIRIDWMNVTAKLIEDAIVTWATTAERFGLKLVELPIAEASSITNRHPFRAPYVIELALQPPKSIPNHHHDINNPYTLQDHHIYHKALLRRLDFVLDLESASSFPSDIKVKYSWGKPNYRYTQYIHKSGLVLVQITEDGNFLMLANRLCNHRAAASPKDTNNGASSKFANSPTAPAYDNYHYNNSTRPSTATNTSTSSQAAKSPRPLSTTSLFDRPSPFSSPLVRALTSSASLQTQHHPTLSSSSTSTSHRTTQTLHPDYSHVWPEQLKEEFETFCLDRDWLANFYDELGRASVPVSAKSTPLLSATIPKLGLPPVGDEDGEDAEGGEGLLGPK